MDRERHFIRTMNPVCNVVMRSERQEDPGGVLDEPDDVHGKWSRKSVQPHSSFHANCRSYETLPEIASETCKTILENNKAKKSSSYEVLTACKHIFDNHIVASEVANEVRKQVFDRVMRDRDSRRILVNMILWKDRRRIEELEKLYGSENPFKASFQEEIDDVLGHFQKLLSELGLTSPWDCETVFTSVLLKEKIEVLMPIVAKLITSFELPASKASVPAKVLIGNLLPIFSSHGCSIGSESTRTRLGGFNTPRCYHYTLSQDCFVDTIASLITP